MAMGAQGGDVLCLVIRQGMRLALAGLAVGMPVALSLTQLMKGMLFGVSAKDPLTFIAVAALFIAVAALLLIVALIAVLIPARRAMKVDPLVALRAL